MLLHGACQARCQACRRHQAGCCAADCGCGSCGDAEVRQGQQEQLLVRALLGCSVQLLECAPLLGGERLAARGYAP